MNVRFVDYKLKRLWLRPLVVLLAADVAFRCTRHQLTDNSDKISNVVVSVQRTCPRSAQ